MTFRAEEESRYEDIGADVDSKLQHLAYWHTATIQLMTYLLYKPKFFIECLASSDILTIDAHEHHRIWSYAYDSSDG